MSFPFGYIQWLELARGGALQVAGLVFSFGQVTAYRSTPGRGEALVSQGLGCAVQQLGYNLNIIFGSNPTVNL